MFEIEYLDFTIKLKHIPKYKEWLVAVEDTKKETLVSNWFSNQQEAEKWAKNIIENIKPAEK